MIINKFNIGVDNIRVFFKGLLSVLLFVGIAGLSELVLAEEGPLIIEDPWPPYTYGDIGEPNGGIAVEITKTIFQEESFWEKELHEAHLLYLRESTV